MTLEIDIDDIGNLENLSMKNVRILKQSLMVESLLEMLARRRRQVFYKPTDFPALTNAVSQGIFSINKQNTVSQLGEHDFSCDQIFLVDRQYIISKEGNFFSDQMNRNCVDRNYWYFRQEFLHRGKSKDVLTLLQMKHANKAKPS